MGIQRRKMIKLLDLKKQYETHANEIDEAIRETIRASSFIGGPNVIKFENNFKDFVQTTFCVGVANGTDAIEIGLKSLNLPIKSEVIVPANSFISTSEAVTTGGHKVVFCDIDPQTSNICLKDLKSKITKKTKAIIVVHLYGLPAPINSILKLAKEFDLKIIEDCAQAHGATIKGKHVGSFGDLGTFSFYPGKNLGAYGDAGAIVTSNTLIAEKCRRISNHGRTKKYDHDIEGRNSRLDALQASILSTKLVHLEDWISKRRALAEIYRRKLPEKLLLKAPDEYSEHAYHLFVINTERRDELMRYLEEHGVETGIHYPIALPDLDAYKYLNKRNSCPNATQSARRVLSLPIGEHLSVDEVNTVCELINNFCGDNYD